MKLGTPMTNASLNYKVSVWQGFGGKPNPGPDDPPDPNPEPDPESEPDDPKNPQG